MGRLGFAFETNIELCEYDWLCRGRLAQVQKSWNRRQSLTHTANLEAHVRRSYSEIWLGMVALVHLAGPGTMLDNILPRLTPLARGTMCSLIMPTHTTHKATMPNLAYLSPRKSLFLRLDLRAINLWFLSSLCICAIVSALPGVATKGVCSPDLIRKWRCTKWIDI